MAKKDGNFDKNFLITSALLAIGGAAGLFYLKGDFAQQLVTKKVTPSEEKPAVPIKDVVATRELLRQSFVWAPKVIDGKPIPLNKSIPVIMQGGQLFDIYKETPQLRAPMTNEYLRTHDLEYLSPNVGDLDPDNDGFTNLEEFEHKTNPKDPKSLPPSELKLYFVARVQDDYVITLKNQGMPAQVKRDKPAPQGSKFIDGLPKNFGFDPASQDRFTAQTFEMKQVGTAQVPQLTVKDNASGATLVLVYNQPVNLAEYQAELQFRLGKVQNYKVKKGESFYLPTGTKYLLKDVQEASATVCAFAADGSLKDPIEIKPR